MGTGILKAGINIYAKSEGSDRIAQSHQNFRFSHKQCTGSEKSSQSKSSLPSE